MTATVAGSPAELFALYARLRRDDPVHWSSKDRYWMLTRYSDVRAVMRTPLFVPYDLDVHLNQVAGPNAKLPAVRTVLKATLVTQSGPEHLAARRYLGRVLGARPASDLAPVITRLTDELLAKAQRDGGCDLVRDFADPLPLRVVAALLGLPDEETAYIGECCYDTLRVLLSGTSTATDFERVNERIALGLDYLHSHVMERRRKPREDGLTRLITLDPDEPKRSDRELAAYAYFLFMAGMETTAAFLANSCLALFEHPEERERWTRGDVSDETATEELLRLAGPVHMTLRVATEDTTVGSQTVKAGDLLALILAAANRDPDVFPEPDRLDLDRKGAAHIGFGEGAHSCLGAMLAKLEGRIALSRLSRCQSLTPQTAVPSWVAHDKFAKVASLPVRLN